MSFKVFDRVKETSTTSGSGAVTLAGAVNGFQAFSGVYSDGDTTHYVIVNGGQWEAGLGTYSANALSRDVVFESSNNGNKINLLNTSTIFVSYPAARSVLAESSSLNVSGVPYINASGHIASNTGITYNPNSYSLNVAGNITANTGIFNNITTNNGSDSGIAFFAGNTLSSTSSFLYDSGNKRLGINQLAPEANLHVTTSNASVPASIFEATAGQSSNLTEWHDLTGTTVAYVTKSGDAYFNNVQVTGTLTYLNTDILTIQDKNIELASTSGSPLGDDTVVDGGGITLLSSDGNKTITWNNGLNSWNFNQNIDIDNGYSLTINDYTLPAADGTENYIIKTNGSGTLSFVDATTLVPPASPTGSVQYNSGGSFAGTGAFTYDGNTLAISGVNTAAPVLQVSMPTSHADNAFEVLDSVGTQKASINQNGTIKSNGSYLHSQIGVGQTIYGQVALGTAAFLNRTTTILEGKHGFSDNVHGLRVRSGAGGMTDQGSSFASCVLFNVMTKNNYENWYETTNPVVMTLGNGYHDGATPGEYAYNAYGTIVDGVLSAVSGGGTDVAGGNLWLVGGKGTGAGAGGHVVIKTSPAGGSGTTRNDHATVAEFDDDGKTTLTGISTTGTVLELNAPSGHTSNVFETKNYLGATGVYIDTSGNLFANSKSFLINHPSKQDKKLRHVSLEGPEHGVYFRGVLHGEDTITVPEYWDGLVDKESITVHLTPNKRYFIQPYVKEVDIPIIKISKSFEGAYIVHGTRKDVANLEVEI